MASSKRIKEKPLAASWPFWKVILGGLSGQILFTFLVWLSNSTLHTFKTGVFLHPLKMHEIFLGSIWLLFALWMYWAWKPRRKNRHWHRWLYGACVVLYFSGLMLLLAVSYWNALLRPPWNWIVNGSLIMFYIMAWVLPAISYDVAEKLSRKLFSILSWPLAIGGSAGIVGGKLGMQAARSGELWIPVFVIALMFSPLALFLAQMGATEVWKDRPWAKEDE